MPRKSILLPLDREIEIAKMAGQIAAARFPDGPVDPEGVAALEGIQFQYAPFPEEFDGTLAHLGGAFFIICNDRVHARGSARSRFTFSHELGHFYLHRDLIAGGDWPEHYSRTEFASDDPLEKEADCFAANLLLPEKAFCIQANAATGPTADRVEHLATFFGASLTATAFRLLMLNLLPAPAAVLRWSAIGELVTRRMSDETALKRRHYRGLIDMPPAGSATMRAIEDLSWQPTSAPSPVMDWFPKLTGYDLGDEATLCETVLPLGQYGWLTIVHHDRT